MLPQKIVSVLWADDRPSLPAVICRLCARTVMIPKAAILDCMSASEPAPRELHAVGIRAKPYMVVLSTKPGSTSLQRRSPLCAAPQRFPASPAAPTQHIRPSRTATALAYGTARSSVETCALRTTRSAISQPAAALSPLPVQRALSV
jgi:hypothetical protein